MTTSAWVGLIVLAAGEFGILGFILGQARADQQHDAATLKRIRNQR